jgi:hypothetical protein
MVVDRFHIQKNFAEALEKFFRRQERALKKVLQRKGKVHEPRKMRDQELPKVRRAHRICPRASNMQNEMFPIVVVKAHGQHRDIPGSTTDLGQ